MTEAKPQEANQQATLEEKWELSSKNLHELSSRLHLFSLPDL